MRIFKSFVIVLIAITTISAFAFSNYSQTANYKSVIIGSWVYTSPDKTLKIIDYYTKAGVIKTVVIDKISSTTTMLLGKYTIKDGVISGKYDYASGENIRQFHVKRFFSLKILNYDGKELYIEDGNGHNFINQDKLRTFKKTDITDMAFITELIPLN